MTTITFIPGDVVTLKSNPEVLMTVAGPDLNSSGHWTVQWISDVTGHMHFASFKAVMLTKVDMGAGNG